MSVTVNQLNRAVSQAAVEAVTTARQFTYRSLFALPGGFNLLNGTYKPFTPNTDSGWWGNVLSDANGYLASAAVLTCYKRCAAHTFNIAGIGNNYPVDFTLEVYRDNVLQKTVTVTGNDKVSTELVFEHAYDADTYVLTITRISRPNDVLKVSTASFGLTVSSLMKEPGRRIHGRVEVTYRNALSDSTVEATQGAHASSGSSLGNESINPSAKFFKLYDNTLDGSYKVAGASSEIGWWPKTMPNASGQYATPQSLTMTFSQRTLYGISVYGDAVNGDYPVDFTITVTNAQGTSSSTTVTANDSPVWSSDTVYLDATSITITISKASQASRPAVIMEVPITSAVTYNDEGLVDIDLLEELSYEDAIEKLGGISANELTVNFNNEDKSFYFNSVDSSIAGQLKKNRRVRAWLGVELPDRSDTLWEPLGTFWTYSWEVPVGSLIAKAVAFDTLGLLGTKTYYDHDVYTNISIGALVDTVLTSAKEQISFLTWSIEPSLYSMMIPVAWFEYDSYTAALNKIASCDFINIYCARDGSIQVRSRLTGIQAPDDAWSDATNIISKTYPTLHTDLPNYLDVSITRVVQQTSEELLNISEATYTVAANETRAFVFNNPAVAVDSVTITSTAAYEYEWHSWGLRVTFTEAGILTGITATGTALHVDKPTSVHLQNAAAIEEDGVISCEISNDFIQTAAHASRVANYIYSRISESRYDAEVQYRGDITLTLNSKISLPEGIAQDNLYFIKRHELFWNGSLNGSARLNT